MGLAVEHVDDVELDDGELIEILLLLCCVYVADFLPFICFVRAIVFTKYGEIKSDCVDDSVGNDCGAPSFLVGLDLSMIDLFPFVVPVRIRGIVDVLWFEFVCINTPSVVIFIVVTMVLSIYSQYGVIVFIF